jgi:hypothetical protein
MVMTGKKEEVDKIIDKMPSYPVPNKAFRNLGNLKFSDEGMNWGLAEPSFSNGAAYGDLDNDGDLDLVVNNVNQDCFVYRNNSRAVSNTNYISLKLKGKGQNTFAIGANIKIFQKDNVITREMMPSRGFQSSVDYKVIIGVGTKPVDSMVIVWPDVTVTKIINPQVNKNYLLQQQEGKQYVPDSDRKQITRSTADNCKTEF